METTNVTLRMERGLKESADELFGSLGLSFSTAVNLFVRKALRTRGLPFEVTEDSMTSADVARAALIDSLLASPEALRRLSAIGEGTPSSYSSVASVEEAKSLVDSLGAKLSGGQ
ncbi:MAG: type II toxin-antitoxin system RelB/DinJ family antitoxin [Atopobiaceae bacterium]|nr:type II toxin-antitoxin system RelB/DinJ family antitoxin [Atopobiaceae bacterium]